MVWSLLFVYIAVRQGVGFVLQFKCNREIKINGKMIWIWKDRWKVYDLIVVWDVFQVFDHFGI